MQYFSEVARQLLNEEALLQDDIAINDELMDKKGNANHSRLENSVRGKLGETLEKETALLDLNARNSGCGRVGNRLLVSNNGKEVLAQERADELLKLRNEHYSILQSGKTMLDDEEVIESERLVDWYDNELQIIRELFPSVRLNLAYSRDSHYLKPPFVDETLHLDGSASAIESRTRSNESHQRAAPVRMISESLLVLIKEQRTVVDGSNSLDQKTKENVLRALGELQALVEDAPHLDQASDVDWKTTWLRQYLDSLNENLELTFGARNIANATIPTSIILGCSALGALVAGPVGFGAGTVFGHLITGQVKPGQASDRLKDLVIKSDGDST